MLNGEQLARAIVQGSNTRDAQRFDPTGRHLNLNASEAGDCIRQQWYKKRPVDKHTPGGGYAMRGHIVERWVVESMKTANLPLSGAGHEQETLYDKERRIAATPDGHLAYDEGGPVIPLEIKSVDPRTNKTKNLPRAGHVTQFRISMELLHTHLQRKFKTKKKLFDHGLLLYVDASNVHDIQVEKIERDPKILTKYEKRAAKVLNARTDKNLDREGKTNGQCKDCDFQEQCGVLDAAISKGPKRANRNSVLHKAVVAYNDAKALIDSAQANQDEAKELIKQELVSRDTDEVSIAGSKVKLATVEGRTTTDLKAMKADGIDVDAYQKTGKPSERLTIKTS